MVTFEEVRENSDDEEVSTKESFNCQNLEKLFLKLFMEHQIAKAHLQMKTFKAGPNDNIN